MMRFRLLLGTIGAFMMLAPASATAVTVGRLPSSDPGTCTITTSASFLTQVSAASGSAVVPDGGGVITSWSTAYQPGGTPLALVVFSPFAVGGGGDQATVLGVDAETAPGTTVATFRLARPIAVQAGDLIGLVVEPNTSVRCFSTSGSGSDSALGGAAPLGVGSLATATAPGPGVVVDVSAEVTQSVDVGLGGFATPSPVPLGGGVDLSFPITGDIAVGTTFTDTLPSGLAPVAAVATDGTCTVAGQAVHCTTTTVPATVHVFARATTVGSITDTASVTSALSDPNPANNAVTVPLTVTAPAPGKCHVPSLAGAPLGVARSVLPLVGCTAGKVTRKSSRRVPRGQVISTTPGTDTVAAAGTPVAIVVSSGPAPRHRRRR